MVNPAAVPRYGEDHESFRASVQRLLATEAVPHLTEWRASGQVPSSLMQSLGQYGFLGTGIPEDFGGGGTGDPLFTAVLIEEIVAVGAIGLALVLAQHCGVAMPAALRLPDSDMRTTAVTHGAAGQALLVPLLLDGVLEAHGVPGASVADYVLVAHRAPDGQARAGLLARRDVGVVSGAVGLGGRESGLGDLRLTSAALAAAIPDPDPALIRRDADLWTAVAAAAGARYALALAVSYVTEREVFGRPLSVLQNTQMRLAEIGAQAHVIQGFVNRCLGQLAVDTLSAVDAAAARVGATEAFDRAVDQSLQLHGGYGYIREYPVSHAYADARFLRQAAATIGDPRPLLASAMGLNPL